MGRKWIWILGGATLALAAIAAVVWRQAPSRRYVPVTLAFSPGRLSAAHAFLQNNCAACHTPGKGVQASNCVACHANNKELLSLQPTAFHASVQTCSPCHAEHQGANRRPTDMDHVALARAGLRELARQGADKEGKQVQVKLAAWIRQHRPASVKNFNHPKVTTEEATLDCQSCHSNQGQGQTMHATLMGPDCASCHATAQWTIPEFKHPSPRSTDCSQCHQAPPSHYMMHFEMMSKTVARQREARVDQCYSCHQVDAWNNIKGVGWYDHM